jgi:hypothetical protein
MDFERSWSRLRHTGVQQLTDLQKDGDRIWVHFRLPDGTVVELIGHAPPER